MSTPVTLNVRIRTLDEIPKADRDRMLAARRMLARIAGRMILDELNAGQSGTTTNQERSKQ